MENEIFIGVENYFRCKFYGDIDDLEGHQWFVNDKIPLKNGHNLDYILFDYEEIFEFTGKENRFFEISCKDKIRYFRKLNINTFLINKYSTYHYYKSVDELVKLNENFLFLIDAGDYESIPNIILSENILKLVKNNFCKIVLNTSYEPFSDVDSKFINVLNNFSNKYNLNKNNLKILNGNLIVTNYEYFNYEFIPYCYFLENPWFVNKDTYPSNYSVENFNIITNNFIDKKEKYLSINRNIKKFDKKILCYNRRPHAHRRYLFYSLYIDELIRNNTYLSLNNNPNGIVQYTYEVDANPMFSNEVNSFFMSNFNNNWSFDGRDLNINLANNFDEDYHKKTFVSLVSETSVKPNVIFFSEKIFKPIYACQPFIISGNAYSLRKLKEFGFKTFDKWWDESYDDEHLFINRVEKIKNILRQISIKTDEELSTILIEMEDVISHNYDIFVSYQNQLLLESLNKIN